MINPQKASDILALAADTLTEEEWTKGSLFAVKMFDSGKNRICRCAHGQIQWCGLGEELRKQAQIEADRVIASFGDNLEEFQAYVFGKALNYVVPFQPNVYIYLGVEEKEGQYNISSKIRSWSLGENYQTILAHYYAGRVGLSFAFNDGNRTYQEVIEKLKEAAALALLEGN